MDKNIDIINQCQSRNKIGHHPTKYGYEDTYIIGKDKIVLTFQQFPNGEDDYQEELVAVSINGKII